MDREFFILSTTRIYENQKYASCKNAVNAICFDKIDEKSQWKWKKKNKKK